MNTALWFLKTYTKDAIFVVFVYVLLSIFFGTSWLVWLEVMSNETSTKATLLLCMFGVGLYYATKFAFTRLTVGIQTLVGFLKKWGHY